MAVSLSVSSINFSGTERVLGHIIFGVFSHVLLELENRHQNRGLWHFSEQWAICIYKLIKKILHHIIKCFSSCHLSAQMIMCKMFDICRPRSMDSKQKHGKTILCLWRGYEFLNKIWYIQIKKSNLLCTVIFSHLFCYPTFSFRKWRERCCQCKGEWPSSCGIFLQSWMHHSEWCTIHLVFCASSMGAIWCVL